jgi:CAAX protease family protein
MPNLADHILIFLIAIALPIYAFATWNQYKHQISRGKPNARKNAYLETLVIEWALFLSVIILWSAGNRSYADLGLRTGWNLRFSIALLITVAICAFLILQWFQVRKSIGRIPDSLKNQVDPISEVIPQTYVERKLFVLVSLTAGICEEVLYRGFLIWYIDAFAGLTVAALVSIVISGLGHSYQGVKSMFKTMIMGAVLVALYLISSSLICSMILHAITNITGGFIGSEVLKARRSEGEESAFPR